MENRGQIAWLSKEFWAQRSDVVSTRTNQTMSPTTVSQCQNVNHRLTRSSFCSALLLFTATKLKAFGSINDDLFIPGDKFTKKWEDFFCGECLVVVSHIMAYLDFRKADDGGGVMTSSFCFGLIFTWYHLCTFPVRIAYIYTYILSGLIWNKSLFMTTYSTSFLRAKLKKILLF